MTDCIEWMGARTTNGYGQTRVDGVTQYLHRLEWTKHYGEIPVGMFVLHKCDNPPCYNIEHLYCGTPKQNTADAIRRGRFRRGEAKPQSKLTEGQVLKIRRELQKGITQRALAARYKVDPSTISHIGLRKQWTHI